MLASAEALICSRRLAAASWTQQQLAQALVDLGFDSDYDLGSEAGSLLVGVCMVDVVLDPPWLKGVDEGGKHEGAHNILHQLVLAEGTVPTVMPYHKELQHKLHQCPLLL